MNHTVREVALDNGAEGLVINAPGVDVVRILVEFRAGFDFADHDKYELPHVMEHMMFTNKTYPRPRQFSKAIERNGAFNNAYTNSTSLEYDYECAAFEAERIAKLIAVQITEPIFPPEELKTELGNVAEELSSSISNHGRTTADNLRSASVGTPNLQRRIDQLPTITDQDLHDWFAKTHTARNMRFIVAGDIDFDKKIMPHLDVALPEGERLTVPKLLPKPVAHPVVDNRDIPQIYYMASSALHRSFDYRELIAARIMTSVLSDGFTSNLLGKAREKGLVYGLGMGVSKDIHDSEWYLGGMVTPANATNFFKLANHEIKKVQQGKVSQTRFKGAKQLMRGNRARNYQKISNLVNYYDGYFRTGYNDFDQFYKLLDEITLEESVAAFNKLFEQKNRGFSFVGDIDEATAEKYARILAPLWQND